MNDNGNAERLSDIVAEVAKYMPGWKQQFYGDRLRYLDGRVLKRDDGAEIIFHVYWNKKDRVNIHGSYPKSDDGHTFPYTRSEERPGISVSITKAPEKIAKDIERRFLPPYLELYEAGLEALQGHNNRLKKRQQMYARLQRVFPALELYGHGNEYDKYLHVYNYREISGDVKVYSEEHETVEIHLKDVPIGKAEAFLKMLTEK